MASAIRELASGLRFPEGPVALPDGGIALVEIEAGTVSRIGPDGVRSVLARPGGGPNGLAPGPDGALYLCNNGGFLWDDQPGMLRPYGTPPDYAGGRIERLDPVSGVVRPLYEGCGEHRLRGPNDLVFDRDGGIWFTDLGKVRARDRDHGGLYYARADGSAIVEAAYPMLTPNGVGLSPDGRTVYVAETEPGRLWAFDLDAPGRIARAPFPSPHGGRLLYRADGYDRFDSLALEAGGNVCVAALVSGTITVVSPAGNLVRRRRMPPSYPTNICFGGPDLRTAYITVSGTGRLVALEWDAPGLPLAFAANAPGGQAV